MEAVSREITVKAVMENLDRVIAFAEETLTGLGCPPKARMQITLSLEELYANVVNYAYASSPGDCGIRIELARKDEHRVAITLQDWGKAFDPLAKEDPDIFLSANDRPIGGLGIFIVKKSMDSVSYRREDGKNIITMTKSW